jgi:MarR family transcriptional regulator, transcriptional regulator for hemolysin
MPPPLVEPIGLFVTRRARVLSRGFERALNVGGGSLPGWLVLASLKGGLHGTQREIADAVGIEGPTLTHHLNRMETGGLVTRKRDPENRRAHLVELTDAGEREFRRLLRHVQAFDRRLRAGFSDEDLSTLRQLLARLAANAADGGGGQPDEAPAPENKTVAAHTMSV